MWHWAHFGGVLTESWGIYCWYTAGFRNDMGWQNVEFVINWFVYRYFIQIWTNQWEGYSKLISRFYIDRFIVAKYSFGPIVSPPTLSKDGNLCWEHRSKEKCWRTSENISNTVSLRIFSSFSQVSQVSSYCHALASGLRLGISCLAWASWAENDFLHCCPSIIYNWAFLQIQHGCHPQLDAGLLIQHGFQP